MEKMVSAIIPAYNEEKTIGDIVRSAIGHPLILEVIVVDDGSTDLTILEAENAGARVIRLVENGGKASAMDRGVREAKSDVILFLDGDVVGLTHEKISTIIDPVIAKRLDMHVGIISRPSLRLLSKRVFYILPVLSGLRALSKALWYKVPRSYREGFRIEIALNHAARKWGRGTGYEVIGGLTHVIKERKHGIVKGVWHRLRMIMEIFDIAFILYIAHPIRSPFQKLRRKARVEFDRLS